MKFKQFWRKHEDSVWRIGETALILSTLVWGASKLSDKINPPVQKPPISASTEFKKQRPLTDGEVAALEEFSRATKSFIVIAEKTLQMSEQAIKETAARCGQNSRGEVKK